MATLLLFGPARAAAGVARIELAGATPRAVVEAATDRFGPAFAPVLEGSRVWVNGEPAELDRILAPTDEVAVLPPVSGG